jgi:molybdate-binding protein
MARPQVGSTPEIATTAAGSASRLLYKYKRLPKSHNAVGVAVAQNRADWGIAIETISRQYGLGFIPAQDEHYDFIVPRARLARPAVQRFRSFRISTLGGFMKLVEARYARRAGRNRFGSR